MGHIVSWHSYTFQIMVPVHQQLCMRHTMSLLIRRLVGLLPSVRMVGEEHTKLLKRLLLIPVNFI